MINGNWTSSNSFQHSSLFVFVFGLDCIRSRLVTHISHSASIPLSKQYPGARSSAYSTESVGLSHTTSSTSGMRRTSLACIKVGNLSCRVKIPWRVVHVQAHSHFCVVRVLAHSCIVHAPAHSYMIGWRSTRQALPSIISIGTYHLGRVCNIYFGRLIACIGSYCFLLSLTCVCRGQGTCHLDPGMGVLTRGNAGTKLAHS